jgi:hypothetical protein
VMIITPALLIRSLPWRAGFADYSRKEHAIKERHA